MCKKGQIMIMDLFMSFFVFILLISSVIFTWNAYTLRLNDKLDYEEMMTKAFHVSDLLIENPGVPSEWEKSSSSVEVIGLATKDRVLSEEKVNAFINFDESKIKS